MVVYQYSTETFCMLLHAYHQIRTLYTFVVTRPVIDIGGGGHLPANLDTYGNTLLVPDLSARVSLLDKDDNLIHLGEDPEWRKVVTADRNKLRRNEGGEGWVSGRFLHPHDACFDRKGNIFVAEWVHSGRITRLRKL